MTQYRNRQQQTEIIPYNPADDLTYGGPTPLATTGRNQINVFLSEGGAMGQPVATPRRHDPLAIAIPAVLCLLAIAALIYQVGQNAADAQMRQEAALQEQKMEAVKRCVESIGGI